MSSLSQIIQQLRDSQIAFNNILARVESLGENVNQSLLIDLIKESRELHEGSVILSYVLFDEYTQKSKQLQELKFLPKNLKNLNPTNSENLTQEEIIEELEDEISSIISVSSSDPIFRNQEEEDNSLAAKLARKKIENLNNEIGINEKFLFTNELFNGNTEHFLKTIEELNNCVSLTEANMKLSAVAQKRSWILEEEPYLKLQSLLSRKYQ
jgi:hypothetical protein